MTSTRIALYRTAEGPAAQIGETWYRVGDAAWDELFNDASVHDRLSRLKGAGEPIDAPRTQDLLPPIGSQEVWAAGVTYYRSKTARVEESEAAGGGDFYDRVYVAARPELFFKATAQRVSGPGQPVRIRRDARWSVPEPELALAVNSSGEIFGYSIGNDVSARDIEGENPLYLPQAKVYDQSCGLGPGLLIPKDPLPLETTIRLAIYRDGEAVVEDQTTLSELKRTFSDLVEYLYRETSFPNGCYLLTGTGIVPPDDFTLKPGDRVRITIEPIGTLENHVVREE